MKKIFIALLLFLWGSSGIAQELSDTEREIINRIDANHAEALEFLENNVNINSGTMNFDGVRKVGENYKEAYDELGFETKWISQDEVNRAGHFFAKQKGLKGKSLLLIGHLDTVFEPESSFQKYEV